MTDAAGGEQQRGVGARLRAAREKRGLTVLQAAEKLHLDVRIVEALEAQDFGALGADVYVRGHLRRYAELTGESPAQLQELYVSGTQAAQPDLTRIPHRESERRGASLMLPVLLLAVGCAAAGLLWWLFTLPVPTPQPLAEAPLASPAAGSPDSAATAAATPAVPDGAPAAHAAVATAAAPVVQAPRAGEAQLALAFTAESWVEVSDADGRHLLQGLVASGSARVLNGTPPLRVVLGNAPAVALRLDGHPVVVAGLVRRDGSAHLLIDAAGRASAAAPRLAHGD